MDQYIKPDGKERMVGQSPDDEDLCLFKNILTDDRFCLLQEGSATAGYRWNQ